MYAYVDPKHEVPYRSIVGAIDDLEEYVRVACPHYFTDQVRDRLLEFSAHIRHEVEESGLPREASRTGAISGTPPANTPTKQPNKPNN